jgi:hypothetical protein
VPTGLYVRCTYSPVKCRGKSGSRAG